MNIRLSIEGLEFNKTQDRVRNQLEGIVGVQDVLLSEGQNYVDIYYNEQTSVEEIDSHLKNNGYKIMDIT
jgi:cation transport ATPase